MTASRCDVRIACVDTSADGRACPGFFLPLCCSYLKEEGSERAGEGIGSGRRTGQRGQQGRGSLWPKISVHGSPEPVLVLARQAVEHSIAQWLHLLRGPGFDYIRRKVAHGPRARIEPVWTARDAKADVERLEKRRFHEQGIKQGLFL